MFLFHNDYNETCHPAVMAKIVAAGQNQYAGYGMNLVLVQRHTYAELAAERILQFTS